MASYSIRYTDFGLVIRISDTLNPELAQSWSKEVSSMLEGFEGTFNILLDLRGDTPSDSKQVFEEATALVRQSLEVGMKHLAIITDNEVMRHRVEQILEAAGEPELVRWFDAQANLTGRRDAEAWLRQESV